MAEMDKGDSVTIWIESLKGGAADAADKLWCRYFDGLVRLARDRLRGAPRAVADEEDAALAAFDSFIRGASRGRYPRLDDRDDLWRLLVTITERKALDQVQHERRQRRGSGRVVNLSGPGHPGGGTTGVVDATPTPEFAAMVADECRSRLGRLRDDSLRRVALLRMEGYTTEEIADQIGCSVRTVARKVELIRRSWTDEEGSEP